jgi:hypothetical protein
MKLKHILVLLAASALVVVAWKLRQGGEPDPGPVDGQSASAVQSTPEAAPVELQAPASVAAREAGAAPAEVQQPAETPPAPVALDIVEIGDGLPTDERPFQDGGDAPVSGVVAVPDYGLKYVNVDAAGRVQAAESLRNRVRLSKGRSLKDGGMDEKTVARLMAEAEWLDENPEP